MNFAIAVTPKQFFLGIFGFVVFCLGLVTCDYLAVKTTPEEQKYGRKVVRVVSDYVELDDKVSAGESKNSQAVVNADLPFVRVTPNDWRLNGTGTFTIKNVVGTDVDGVNLTLILKSQSLGTNIFQLVPLKRFDKALKPDEVATFELKFNALAMTALRPKEGTTAHIKDYVGSHNISSMEVIVHNFFTEKPYGLFGVAPQGEDKLKLDRLKTRIDTCQEYLDSLAVIYRETNRISLSKNDLKQNRTCLDQIILQ